MSYPYAIRALSPADECSQRAAEIAATVTGYDLSELLCDDGIAGLIAKATADKDHAKVGRIVAAVIENYAESVATRIVYDGNVQMVSSVEAARAAAQVQ